ncbi:MAG: response regulator [Blautia sp.]|nr:response regulator [Blautia sp.]
MNNSFAETLSQLRLKNNLSQQQLAELMYVDRSTVASWETGRRLPDALLISRLARCLNTDVASLLNDIDESGENPHVILVDDEKIILNGGLPILEEIMPNASVTGFTRPSEVIRFAKANRIALAFLDVEIGKTNGLSLSRELLRINPRTNVIFLTAYSEYSFDAWSTGACGFMLKPLTAEEVKKQLSFLRYPIRGLA